MAKKDIYRIVDGLKDLCTEACRTIWDHPELAGEEAEEAGEAASEEAEEAEETKESEESEEAEKAEETASDEEPTEE